MLASLIALDHLPASALMVAANSSGLPVHVSAQRASRIACHCEERVARRSNLHHACGQASEARLLRFARNDGGFVSSVAPKRRSLQHIVRMWGLLAFAACPERATTRGIAAVNENKSFGRTPMWFATAGRVP